MTMNEPTRSERPPPAKPPRRRSILDVGPWILLFLTLAGSCGAFHAMLDLCAHFRWYYFWIGLVWSLVIWRRWREWALRGLIVSLLWNGGLLLPYYLPFTQPAVPEGATTVSLISLSARKLAESSTHSHPHRSRLRAPQRGRPATSPWPIRGVGSSAGGSDHRVYNAARGSASSVHDVERRATISPCSVRC